MLPNIPDKAKIFKTQLLFCIHSFQFVSVALALDPKSKTACCLVVSPPQGFLAAELRRVYDFDDHQAMPMPLMESLHSRKHNIPTAIKAFNII
jgi:hypothetical protein